MNYFAVVCFAGVTGIPYARAMFECGWNNPGPYTNQIINNIDSRHMISVSMTILPLKSVPGLYIH